MNTNANQPGRNDPAEKDFEAAERLEGLVELACWLAATAFFGYVWLHHLAHPGAAISKITFVVLTVLSLAMGYYHRFLMLPACDRKRRLMLIADSLGQNTGPPLPVDYWTTTLPASRRRLLLSLAENTYFYPRLLAHEIPGVAALVALITVALLMSIRFGTAEWIELFAVVLLFSEIGFGKLVRQLWARHEFSTLHSACCIVAELRPGPQKLEIETLKLLTEYESIKSRSSVRASKETFKKLNPALTREWEIIRRRLEGEAENDIDNNVQRG